MEKVIEFVIKYWWGQTLIGIFIYALGIQRFFDGWDMDPILCTAIQLVGLILLLFALLTVVWRRNNWKKILRIFLTIIVFLFVPLAVYGNIYMWNKEPDIGNESLVQEEEAEVTDTAIVSISTTTLTPTPTPTLTPTLTPTPTPTPSWNFNAGYISSDWSYWPTDALNIPLSPTVFPSILVCIGL